jgi:hypothetical protein
MRNNRCAVIDGDGSINATAKILRQPGANDKAASKNNTRAPPRRL